MHFLKLVKANIAIVGGGPIGLFLALKLAQRNEYVDVYDKSNWPIDKVCGQGLMPCAVELLRSVGASFREGEDSFSFSGIDYFDNDLHATGKLPHKGAGVKRTVLSEKLLQLATKSEYINLYPMSSVLLKSTSKESSILDIMQNDETKSIEYEYVFACDGLNSTFRKKINQEVLRKSSYRIGAREHYEISPWSNNVQVYWGAGKEIYVTPINNSTVELAYTWYEDSIKSGAKFKERYLSEFPILLEKLGKATGSNDFKVIGPFKRYSKNFYQNKVYLVGDAYRFGDGITGEGIALGLKSANIISRSFKKMGMIDKLKIRLLYFHYGVFVNMALSLSRNKLRRRILIKVFKKFPKFFSMVLNLNDLEVK